MSRTTHAPSRAGHYFNQIVLALACAHLFRHHARIAQPVDNGQLQLCSVHIDGGLAQSRFATDLLELNLLQLRAGHLLRCVTKHGLRDPARVAEDHARSGIEAERHIERFGL